jgi:Cd2+/Zn2+-exporting ATPase
VAVLLLIGGMLEEFVSARAGRALDALARLLPDPVTVRREGRDVVIPPQQVRVGDVVLVRSGERIAVDGEIVMGSGVVNQAAITGESMPVDKRPGILTPVTGALLHELSSIPVIMNSARLIGFKEHND